MTLKDFWHAKISWWHYLIAFIAFAAGYWFLWSLGW